MHPPSPATGRFHARRRFGAFGHRPGRLRPPAGHGAGALDIRSPPGPAADGRGLRAPTPTARRIMPTKPQVMRVGPAPGAAPPAARTAGPTPPARAPRGGADSPEQHRRCLRAPLPTARRTAR
ncbi:hypothetical protein GCM10010315_06720 [Streptomyces luteosporeus]|uniref:Uncharacterized protein n=1 Tax=Streptomyces luteosporeus TaxID=173856 RepID=A0ABN3TJP0_9ACTN